MNENINLCEILKGHEGKTFYSPLWGDIILKVIRKECTYPIHLISDKSSNYINFSKDGKPNLLATECLLFPSKDQRDWNKWVEEQKDKTPKTWSKLELQDKVQEIGVSIVRTFNNRWYDSTKSNTPIEKSALALLKIHQLIDVGYGGNVSYDEWRNDDWKYVIGYYIDDEEFPIKSLVHDKSLIAFHTKEQAIEFLSYPENVQLLKDYFMI